MFESSLTLGMPCPKCGNKIKLTERDMKKRSTFMCQFCENEIRIDSKKILKSLKNARKKARRSLY